MNDLSYLFKRKSYARELLRRGDSIRLIFQGILAGL